MRVLGAGVALAAALAVIVPSATAQIPPVFAGSTTTTSAPPAEQPGGGDLADGSHQAPAGAPDAGGDGAPAPAGGIVVPPEAQRIIDAVLRSGPSSNAALLDRLSVLQQLGLSEQEALRAGLGRFPIAGPARYSHDWLYPRYGPGFRFHLGTDVFAPHGTPVRAPVDGIAVSDSGGLGGLTVKVVMTDGTYFYLAHLAGLVEGFVDGMPVATGDVVGYVGDSGNARGGAPHLHIGIYPHGGPPIDPKPVLDQFLAEAEARLPEVIAAYQAARQAGAVSEARVTITEERRALRPMLATELLRPLSAGSPSMPAELLYLAGADPLRGPSALVDLALEELVDDIDWAAR